MSNEMIERVAKALYDKEHGERTIEECTALAKAAIQAMREPTEEMKDAGFKRTNYLMVWRDMIDAALKED